MKIEQLKEKAEEFDLKNRAIAACMRFLENDKDELPNNWQPALFEFKFRSLGLIFENTFLFESYFVTKYMLFYEGADVGSYKLITSLSGEDIDDYLIFHR